MGQIGSKLELRNKEHIRYITSNNPQSAYANHILDNVHEYGTISTTTALLYSAQKRQTNAYIRKSFHSIIPTQYDRK
jgi:hypothetical protein